ncbi:keratin, type I cytoskeletal 9-like [Mercenaria mercenaria]|uniref:keratin, type I cytoskeletal 9-like n=1 Tax=Mercenaria mercenaria TaxID=6596 RepID=UPI00234F5FD8|nr:keratin, type I cytoskeletal 9-like [Mercenaria mercenaria]
MDTIHLLTISVFVCVLSLCHSQSGGGVYDGLYDSGSGSSYSMSRDSPYDSGRGRPYMGLGMGPSYTEAGLGPSYMRGGSSYMGDRGPSYTGGSTYTGIRDSSFSGYPPYMRGTGRDIVGVETDRMFRGTGYPDRSRTYHRSDRRVSSRGGGGDRGGRGGRCGRGDRPPREGCIGARGGEGGYPVQGGYCPGHMCADGGRSSGVGMGYGTGTQMAMDRRLMTGENEDIRAYEPFAGGPASDGGGGGMMPGMPGMGGPPLGGVFGPPGGGPPLGGGFGYLF